ncbi:MAG: 50S ribosomal protein L25 [Dehalococcoidales bacterium]|nr:50S ribosomal protein L25 [Dehalococcoidales bacterium]
MATLELKAIKRHIEGKKVQELRRKGVTPAHLFGPGVESLAIQCDTISLRNILADAGHTQLVNLKLGQEHNPRIVMVREVQIDNFKGGLLHVDFYQVNLTETIRVNVPVVLIGESAAAKMKGNSLVQELNELTVQCLPANIPSKVDVDVTPLVTANDLVRIKDLPAIKDVTIVNDPGVVVARIAVEVIEVVEKPKTAEEGAEAAAEEGATAEGEKKEAPAKGEKKEAPAKAEKPAKSEKKE